MKHKGHEHPRMSHSKSGGMHDVGDDVRHSKSSGKLYKNEVEHPHIPMQGHPEHGHGAEDFKGMAMDIAYGQAGKAGCMADDKRLRAQHKNYHWADSPAEEAPGSY